MCKRVTGHISDAERLSRRCSEETSQQWRAAGYIVSDLTGPGIESSGALVGGSGVIVQFIVNF